ncbi:flippase-like domain-containing protein [Rhizobium mesosinicum]|uniref:Flippase-like domain-containing protein n=1 Tax=Rhizobium mesosinicum TaxID=335017 RepID=A0ABS7H3A7_9HYPH|nr:flippase-like domain-containing protein [Rhizobium mesosinicum]
MAIVILAMFVDVQHAIEMLSAGASPALAFIYSLFAAGIVLVYGLRWSILLDFRLKGADAALSSLIGLGGNMLLPARGGDLLRGWYSHRKASMPYSEIMSRLAVEKYVDLLTIFLIGILAGVSSSSLAVERYMLAFSTAGFIAVLAIYFMIMFFAERFLIMSHAILDWTRAPHWIRASLDSVVRDMKIKLTFSATIIPSFLTLAMWLSLYVGSYIAIAHMVRIPLTYSEALLVLFAGALGLMIPAAPSGVGTFHASVVSAFLLLGRPASEGLVLGTAIHFLFLVTYSVPALIIGSQRRVQLRLMEKK